MKTKDVSKEDIFFMKEAIRLGKIAAEKGEVPVGAVIVCESQIVASAYNLREQNKMATAHAELLAIEEACRRIGDWRLKDTTLYVTLEPCPMCAGAIVNARIPRVVYGLKDPAAGCCGSVLNLNAYPFNHSFTLTAGVCEEDCRELLKRFFSLRRSEGLTK
jgi:tRNA(adenine34) deaminase